MLFRSWRIEETCSRPCVCSWPAGPRTLIGLAPALGWGGMVFLLTPRPGIGLGDPFRPRKDRFLQKKDPSWSHPVAEKTSLPSPLSLPTCGPVCGSDPAPWQAARGWGGFLSPPHPLPTLLSCCRLFSLPSCFTVRRNKWLTEGPHPLGPPSPFLGPFREPDPFPLHPR